jgi:hypothetical protein
LKESSNDLISSINTPLQKYSTAQVSKINDSSKISSKDLAYNSNELTTTNTKAFSNSNLLSANTTTSNTTTTSNLNTANSCQAQATSPYRYNYK